MSSSTPSGSRGSQPIFAVKSARPSAEASLPNVTPRPAPTKPWALAARGRPPARIRRNSEKRRRCATYIWNPQEALGYTISDEAGAFDTPGDLLHSWGRDL